MDILKKSGIVIAIFTFLLKSRRHIQTILTLIKM